MKTTVYLSRKLLNQLKVKEAESTNLLLTHNLHNITVNGKRVGCSGHIQNVLNDKCVYICTEKSCYQPLSDKNLIRYAADMKDFSSNDLGVVGRNQFVTDDAAKFLLLLVVVSIAGAFLVKKVFKNYSHVKGLAEDFLKATDVFGAIKEAIADIADSSCKTDNKKE